MKKLGLVGGMGPESTLPYYHDIVYGVKAKSGMDRFPELTIESVNVFKILELCSRKKYDDLTSYLLKALENLAAAGADFAALSANTPHIVFHRLQEISPLPLVSIVETAKDEAKNRGIKRLGLLGTIFTMTGDFFIDPFTNAGIEVVVPTETEREEVNRRIVNELEQGIIKNETLNYFQSLIQRLKEEEGIEAVVLGCTELPLLLNDSVSPVPCLDTMAIHINALVERIMAE